MIEQFSRLSPEARALLEKRLLKNRQPSPSAPPPLPAKSQGPAPLSFAQESLWFLDQLEPQSPLYIIPEAWTIKGPLQLATLEKAFQTLIQRHETLRVQFIGDDKSVSQIPRENVSFRLQLIDLRPLHATQRASELLAHLKAEATRPFSLTHDLLIRAAVIQLDAEEHVLLVTMHHIISDAASMALMYEEISALYSSELTSQPAVLPALPVQYSAFAHDQRQRLQGEALDKESQFWLDRLSGELPVLDLPSDRPRPSGRSFNGLRTYFNFPPKLQQSLKDLSRQEGATLYMTLLTAFALLLHRFSRQDDILIGAPLSTRSRKEYENLIGFFINTIVLRSNFSGDPSFLQALQQVRQLAADSFTHAEVPLFRLVEKLKIPRHGGNPLFQVVFQYLATPTAGPRLQNCQVTTLPMETGTAKFDLTLSVVESPLGLSGNLEYNTDLFNSRAIERFLETYQFLLEGIVQNPSARISEFALLTPAETALLTKWSQTATPYPRQACIHQLFEQAASLNPGAIALEFEGSQLSYEQLNARANQVAHALLKRGVTPGALVGVCLPRSLELIVALLGILKAGGAYAPLDPLYPQDRLAYLIHETAMPLLLTTTDLRQKLFSTFSLPVLALDDPAAFTAEPETNPGAQISSENLAYVLYTSGSTGKPKGVAIPHHGVVRLVKETTFMRFSPDDVYLQFAPISFDASTLEIWGSLLNGARLVIFPPSFSSLQQLGEVIQRHGVTTLWLTAGLFHQMVEEQIHTLRGVRQLLAGGDVLSVPHVLKTLSALPDTQLINGYGPTENTTFTCCFSVPKDWPGLRSVPIGKPISNTQAYILDSQLRQLPIGIPGELFIGGDGLAREYLRAPELTREKFIPNPFPGGSPRLYRTGDIVRWLEDGNMEFVGRADFQVKIRGFRVELGEIENVLVQHPSVGEAVVLARSDNSGAKQLIAYVVPNGPKPEHSALRRFLQDSLPAHMVPGQVLFLERFPLNANGKVDRALLPAPETQSAQKQKTAPRTPEEQTLAQIWSDVFALGPIGIDEDFFELGGHSLLATKVISRVNKEFGADIPLAAIFDHPTVAALAQLISTHKQSGARPKTIISRRARPKGEPHESPK